MSELLRGTQFRDNHKESLRLREAARDADTSEWRKYFNDAALVHAVLALSDPQPPVVYLKPERVRADGLSPLPIPVEWTPPTDPASDH